MAAPPVHFGELVLDTGDDGLERGAGEGGRRGFDGGGPG
jgi:hypothetical protein